MTPWLLPLGHSAGRFIDHVPLQVFSTPSSGSQPAAPIQYVTSAAGPEQDRPATVLGPFTVIEEEVLAKVNDYQRLRQPEYAPDPEVLNLPIFEKITEYGCDRDLQSRLWTEEVARLVAAVNEDRPPEFLGSQRMMAVDSTASHQVLGTLSDIVFQGLQIVIYDNECVLAKHASKLCDLDTMRRCRDSLEYLGTSSQEDGILTYDSKTLLIYREDLFELINLWVAVVARVICRSAEKKSIVIQPLALLATVAAKLEVVCTNLRKFAQISVGNYLPYGLHWTAYVNVRTADARPGIRTSKKDAL